MSPDDELLDGLLGNEPGVPLDLLPWASRVAELIRAPGALEHWRQRCAESFQESRQRHERHKAWKKQYVRPRLLTVQDLAAMPAGEPMPQIPDSEEPYVGGPLRFSPRHALSLGDCFLVVALVHDTKRRDAGCVDPFLPDDMFGMCFWEAQRTHVPGLHGADRLTLDYCMARVEDDLRQTAPPNAERVADHQQHGNRFELVGDIWHIDFEAERGLYKRNKRVGWLAMLLAAPNRAITVAALLGDPDGRLAGDAAIQDEGQSDHKGMQAIKSRLREIEDIGAEAGWSDAILDEKAELMRHLQQALDGAKFPAPLRKAHYNIASQIRAFVRNKLAERMPRLSAHLRAALRLELPDIGYYPPAGTPPWKT